MSEETTASLSSQHPHTSLFLTRSRRHPIASTSHCPPSMQRPTALLPHFVVCYPSFLIRCKFDPCKSWNNRSHKMRRLLNRTITLEQPPDWLPASLIQLKNMKNTFAHNKSHSFLRLQTPCWSIFQSNNGHTLQRLASQNHDIPFRSPNLWEFTAQKHERRRNKFRKLGGSKSTCNFKSRGPHRPSGCNRSDQRN